MSSKGGGTALSRRNYRLASDNEKPKATGEFILFSNAKQMHIDHLSYERHGGRFWFLQLFLFLKQPYLVVFVNLNST